MNGKVDEETQKAIAATVSRMITNEPTHAALLRIGPEAEKRRDQRGRPIISNRINQTVSIPPADGKIKTYRLTFNARGDDLYDGKGWNGLTLNVEFKGSDGVSGAGRRIRLGTEWKKESQKLVPPKTVTSMRIDFILYGSGDVLIDDVELRPLKW